MSNKKETPVSWLVEQFKKDIIGLEFDYKEEINQALEMESKKQQKYDEMIEMLEVIVLAFEHIGMEKPMSLTEVIKEAKEL